MEYPYNFDSFRSYYGKFTPLVQSKVSNEPSGTLNGTLEERIISVIRKSPHITQAEIECSERKVKRLMKTMIDKGMIERVGGRKMGQWIEK
mgnify:CR=1 FL=1